MPNLIISAEENIIKLGIILPKIPVPIGNFQLGSLNDRTLYLSGQGPVLADGTLARGKVGADVSIEEAYFHARRTGLVLISAMRELLGSLNHVERVHKVFGMVNATADFQEHPRVINGCSDLFCEVFGERGKHARVAVGMGSLPGNISVEIDAIISITKDWKPKP